MERVFGHHGGPKTVGHADYPRRKCNLKARAGDDGSGRVAGCMGISQLVADRRCPVERVRAAVSPQSRTSTSPLRRKPRERTVSS